MHLRRCALVDDWRCFLGSRAPRKRVHQWWHLLIGTPPSGWESTLRAQPTYRIDARHGWIDWGRQQWLNVNAYRRCRTWGAWLCGPPVAHLWFSRLWVSFSPKNRANGIGRAWMACTIRIFSRCPYCVHGFSHTYKCGVTKTQKCAHTKRYPRTGLAELTHLPLRDYKSDWWIPHRCPDRDPGSKRSALLPQSWRTAREPVHRGSKMDRKGSRSLMVRWSRQRNRGVDLEELDPK